MSDYDGGESILDINTDDAVEPTIVEDGEYTIRITGYQRDQQKKIVRTSESGFKFFIVAFDIPSEETSKGFTHIFSVPTEDMDGKKTNEVKWRLEEFKRAFNLDELNFDKMIGAEGDALLYTKSSEEYGDQNAVRDFIAGA